jgi:hypothetical protein
LDIGETKSEIFKAFFTNGLMEMEAGFWSGANPKIYK